MFISFQYGPARDGSFKACFRSGLASYRSAANESPLVETPFTKTLARAWAPPPDHTRMNPPRLVFTCESKGKIYFLSQHEIATVVLTQ